MRMQDWMFWTAAAAMALAVLAVLVQAMRQAPEDVDGPGGADLRIYRDQLAEIDRDVTRGTLPEAEAVRLRNEVSRRLLDADRSVQAADHAPQARRFGPALVVVVALIAGAGWLYSYLGAPGYPDFPLSTRIALSDETYINRLSQAEAEAAAPARAPVPADPVFAELIDKLRQAVAKRPDDLRGLELLARNEAALGNFVAAKTAQVAVIAAKGAQVTAGDLAALAEITILAAGGMITDEAERSLVAALQADPTNGTARYYSGLMFAQVGRPDRTFAMWQPLISQSPPDAPWVAPIRAQIEGIAQAAGVRYTLPPALAASGPSAGDIAAAADMTPEDRQMMIAGMVGQLSDRLATEGGPASDWARLITALGVLGEMDRATDILTEAQGLFAASPEDAAVINAAGLESGLIK
jgi:cytochrome c-type biogenesis protein CcmH